MPIAARWEEMGNRDERWRKLPVEAASGLNDGLGILCLIMIFLWFYDQSFTREMKIVICGRIQIQTMMISEIAILVGK